MDYNEVLRYLGYTNQKIEESLNDTIYACMDEIQKSSKPKYVYDIFPITINEKVFPRRPL